MVSLIFYIGLCLLALFYRREHRLYEEELAAIAGSGMSKSTLLQLDWRVVGQKDGALSLQRGFYIRSREDLLRYSVPVVVFVVILLVLQGWATAFAYLALNLIKWFGTTTVLRKDGYVLFFAAVLGGGRIFGRNF